MDSKQVKAEQQEHRSNYTVDTATVYYESYEYSIDHKPNSVIKPDSQVVEQPENEWQTINLEYKLELDNDCDPKQTDDDLEIQMPQEADNNPVDEVVNKEVYVEQKDEKDSETMMVEE